MNLTNPITILKRNIKRMFKYALVGACGSLINMALLYFFTEFVGFWYMFSSIIATLIAFLFNYTFNTIWTYRDRTQTIKKLKREQPNAENLQ